MVEDKLNLSFYGGEDAYSDGDVEDEILEIVRTHKDYEEILRKGDSWPILYHLSGIRENVLSWYDFDPNGSLLEVGSGCGALTGLFCRSVRRVVGIDLSKKRSLINATRNRAYDNLEIVVGNFEDVTLEETFDYVTLIGVLEYSIYYFKDERPFEAMLNRIKRYLKPNGKLILAIENKYGLKYWAGATEDHTGGYFDGLQNYAGVERVRTFAKNELEDLLKSTGFGNLEFYYPVPDYKMPTQIYSDGFLPKEASIKGVSPAFDRDRMLLFNEQLVWDSICKDELFPIFANSFLVIGGLGE